MAVSDYSTTPSENISISGTNIGENCPPAGMNNAVRQLMADIRVFSDGVPSADTLVTKAAAVFEGTQPVYTGRGAYFHHSASALSSGRWFIQPSGGTVPAGMLPGDWLAEY